jgi:peptidyl-prolyl cis-trans isomerase A (cyclophilin A)
VPPINWEATGLTNDAHTVAMARIGGNPNSASSQFFVNLVDNPSLDRPFGEEDYPYVVFGTVIGGGAVVDAIGNAPLRPGTEEPDPPVVISRAYIR